VSLAPGSALAPAASRRGAWLVWLVAGAALALAGVAIAASHPASGEPLCALRRACGLACPTCGVTRALALLARGAWRESLALHPWAGALVLQLLGAWALWAVWLAGRLRVRPDRWFPHALAANAAALIGLWLARLVTGTLPG
jgi:hypothetical protein